jgi:hypothetical protein
VGTLFCAVVLAAGPGPAGETVKSTPGPALTDKDRKVINRVLARLGPRAQARFDKAALTIEQARLFAEVPARLNWQFEYDGWFVFSCREATGGPDTWSGVIIVRRGTNAVAYFQETW